MEKYDALMYFGKNILLLSLSENLFMEMVQKKETKAYQEYRIFKMIENLVSFGFIKEGL